MIRRFNEAFSFRRWGSALHYDILFQARHGFYAAYLLIIVFYVVSLRTVPEDVRHTAELLILFSDPAVVGSFFVGGMVMLERDHHIFAPLFVTPFRLIEYLMSKVVSLTLVALAACTLIHVGVYGADGLRTVSVPFVLGVGLSSALFILIGLIVATLSKNMNHYFILSPLFVTVLFLPALEIVGLWPFASAWLWWIPGKASLVLMGALHQPVGWETGFLAVCWLGLWIVGTAVVTHRMFMHRILGLKQEVRHESGL